MLPLPNSSLVPVRSSLLMRAAARRGQGRWAAEPSFRSSIWVRTMPDATMHADQSVLIPDYLREVYTWAYLTPLATRIFDRQIAVQTILWGNAQRLIDDVLAELQPGDRVFQPAAVYGSLSRQVAGRVGPMGELDVRD